jgi:hypothetical protein
MFPPFDVIAAAKPHHTQTSVGHGRGTSPSPCLGHVANVATVIGEQFAASGRTVFNYRVTPFSVVRTLWRLPPPFEPVLWTRSCNN